MFISQGRCLFISALSGRSGAAARPGLLYTNNNLLHLPKGPASLEMGILVSTYDFAGERNINIIATDDLGWIFRVLTMAH